MEWIYTTNDLIYFLFKDYLNRLGYKKVESSSSSNSKLAKSLSTLDSAMKDVILYEYK